MDITHWEKIRNQADTDYDKSVDRCFALVSENIRSCILDEIKNKIANQSGPNAKLDLLYASRNEQHFPYAKAKSDYESFQIRQQDLKSDLDFLKSGIIYAKMISQEPFELEEEILKAEEGKIVGRATAGYNLFTDEVTQVSNALIDHGSFYKPRELDVFNVRLNTGFTIENKITDLDSGETIYAKNVFSYPSETLMSKTVLGSWKMPFEKAKTGAKIYFDAADRNSFRAGGFEFYVTKGARCGEYTKKVKRKHSYTDKEGLQIDWSVEENLYEPKPDRIVLSQSIGLTYNYYAHPGAIHGECIIDVDRSADYWRTKGKKTSTSFFQKKTRTWDDSRQTIKDDLGLSCKLSTKPTSLDPYESREYEEAFLRAMYDDTFQMFLSVYAKSFDVEQLPETEVADATRKLGAKLGTGVMQLCGNNTYCQFSNIALKTMDELGGTRAQGSTSSVSRVYGKIKKKYNLNTFTIKEGSSAINLRACVDRTRCKI